MLQSSVCSKVEPPGEQVDDLLAWHQELGGERMGLLLLATAGIGLGVADEVPEFMCCIESATCSVFVLRSEYYNWPASLEVAESVHTL